MNLSDKDILELNELCNALVDGTISDKQKLVLGHWLATSLEAREFYVRVLGLSASLYSYSSEMQTGDAERQFRMERDPGARHAQGQLSPRGHGIQHFQPDGRGGGPGDGVHHVRRRRRDRGRRAGAQGRSRGRPAHARGSAAVRLARE